MKLKLSSSEDSEKDEESEESDESRKLGLRLRSGGHSKSTRDGAGDVGIPDVEATPPGGDSGRVAREAGPKTPPRRREGGEGPEAPPPRRGVVPGVLAVRGDAGEEDVEEALRWSWVRR
uniref:Uncharacterized protein n=1 Tax=Ixodes ricinus TaxID=34613 RepID=A0A131Y5Y3_IXORI